jgi:DNA-binding NtrC family response regulator
MKDLSLSVVMVPAYFSDEIAAQARTTGAFGCLGKPFDFDELRQTIQQAVAAASNLPGTN